MIEMNKINFQRKEIKIHTAKLWIQWFVDVLGLLLLFYAMLSEKTDSYVQDPIMLGVILTMICVLLTTNSIFSCYEILHFSANSIKQKRYFLLRPPVSYKIHIKEINFFEIEYEGLLKGYSSLSFRERDNPKLKWTLDYKNDVLKSFVTEMLAETRAASPTNTLPFKIIDKGDLLDTEVRSQQKSISMPSSLKKQSL